MVIFIIINVIKVTFSFLDAESNDSFPTDYSEKRAIPISIPSLQVKNKNGDRYVVRLTKMIFVYRLQPIQL